MIKKVEAYKYNELFYETELEAKKVEFNDRFFDCWTQGSALFAHKKEIPVVDKVGAELIVQDEFWETLRTKLEKFDDSIQTLLSLRENLLLSMREDRKEKNGSPVSFIGRKEFLLREKD